MNIISYLRAKFNFAPSSSGMFKAAVGLISLTVNMTINMWIVKKTNVSKSLCAVVALAGVSILAMVFSQTQTQVMVFALMYYAFYAIYLPLQQAVMLKNDDKSSKGAVSGLFNAAKSFGMMAGPLFAGLVFDINPDYAFMTFGAGLIIAAIICYVNYKMLAKKRYHYFCSSIKRRSVNLFIFRIVLHYIAWMFKCNYFFKKAIFLIYIF